MDQTDRTDALHRVKYQKCTFMQIISATVISNTLILQISTILSNPCFAPRLS